MEDKDQCNANAQTPREFGQQLSPMPGVGRTVDGDERAASKWAHLKEVVREAGVELDKARAAHKGATMDLEYAVRRYALANEAAGKALEELTARMQVSPARQ